MDIKKASALYFSPTGGTKKIAERIAERVCESADFLDVTAVSYTHLTLPTT